jgi:hypothetical protein
MSFSREDREAGVVPALGNMGPAPMPRKIGWGQSKFPARLARNVDRGCRKLTLTPFL